MGIWGAAIGARLYFLQVVQSADLKQRAQHQQQRVLEVSPRRGVIYDRTGAELAISVKVDSVFADPEAIPDPARTARTLSRILQIPADDILKKFDNARNFAWIKRKITAEESAAVQRAKLEGIYFQPESRRSYPKAELAAHVLGFVNTDEEGISGLEYQYNDSVRGEPGEVVVQTDARRRRYDSQLKPAQPGANLHTTIDKNIQYIVEKEMHESIQRTRALGMSVVVMNPNSGEVLAMASYPEFNPNAWSNYPDAMRINRAVNQVYEPGSTFKILTIGSALEEKITRPDEVIDCLMGSIVIAGHRIHDHKAYGLLTVSDVMKNSSGVGSIKLGIRLGPERFFAYVERAGFGRATGVDLPGEEKGLLRPPSRWSAISNAEMSMGQEIGVTPLQILSMVTAVANGGILYRPFVVKRIQQADGTVTETDTHGVRILSTDTTSQLRPMLEGVVTDGTARGSGLDGYTAAGKTGTAQKVINGRYSQTKYVASFVGFAPASNPQIAMIVVIDEPIGIHTGGMVAAPVFKNVAQQVLQYMSVPTDVPAYAPEYKLTEQKKPKKESVPEPKQVAPSFPMPTDMKVLDAAYIPASDLDTNEGTGNLEVPDFTGKSLRQVLELCSKLGLRVRSMGSGAAVQQYPPAGSRTRQGGTVQVRFSTKR